MSDSVFLGASGHKVPEYTGEVQGTFGGADIPDISGSLASLSSDSGKGSSGGDSRSQESTQGSTQYSTAPSTSGIGVTSPAPAPAPVPAPDPAPAPAPVPVPVPTPVPEQHQVGVGVLTSGVGKVSNTAGNSLGVGALSGITGAASADKTPNVLGGALRTGTTTGNIPVLGTPSVREPVSQSVPTSKSGVPISTQTRLQPIDNSTVSSSILDGSEKSAQNLRNAVNTVFGKDIGESAASSVVSGTKALGRAEIGTLGAVVGSTVVPVAAGAGSFAGEALQAIFGR